jgi:ankyrin repeat protein
MDVNWLQSEGLATPLHAAAWKGSTNVAKFLLENGAEMFAKANSGNSPLHSAAFRGKFGAVKLILDQFLEFKALGYDYSLEIDALNTDFHSPLMRAAEGGHNMCAMALLQCGANKLLSNKKGETAAGLARHAGFKDLADKIVRFLINVQLKPEILDPSNYFRMHLP